MEDVLEQWREAGKRSREDADVDFDLRPYRDPGPAPEATSVTASVQTTWSTYQLKSLSCQPLPGLIGLPAMMISHSRILLDITGIRPTERTTARAATGTVSMRGRWC